MTSFFSNQVGETIEWFGLTHILIMLGFILSLLLLSYFSPRIKNSRKEKWIRFSLLFTAIIFEWKIFESRMLVSSVFRMPLCAIALYGLAFAVTFKKEKAFKIFYFYTFGTFLTFIFFDTQWGLDRWSGWTFFGAHATIGWFAVYGVRVLGYKLTKRDLLNSMILLAGYALVSGYATYKYGGSDELFLFSPPVEFANSLIEIHPILYLGIFCSLAALLMYAMFIPIQIGGKLSTTNKK